MQRLEQKNLTFENVSKYQNWRNSRTKCSLCLHVVDSVLDSAFNDDDSETVKGFSDDGHSYAGTIVRGVLRGDSE